MDYNIYLDKENALKICEIAVDKGFTLNRFDGYSLHPKTYLDGKQSGDKILSLSGINYYLK